MQESVIVGVDVSKATLDICFKPSGYLMKIDNDKGGFEDFCLVLKKHSFSEEKVLIVMEHTGQYSYRFENFLKCNCINYCKVPALQIKRSLGVIRGKNDKIDASRIGEYGWLRRHILECDSPVDGIIQKLQSLLNLRQKLVRDRSGYISRLKEMIASGTCVVTDFEGKLQHQTIAFFTKKITQIETEIKTLIQSDANIQRTCELLRSIKGVGWIIAAYMIGCTRNFKKFTNARKFNCYAGLAPFSYESGSSIRGRSRVSHLANKEAKSLLNMAACSAIRYDTELKLYYQKRVSEGKRKMSCLNIIRSKIVARMFAVVKRQSEYQEFKAVA